MTNSVNWQIPKIAMPIPSDTLNTALQISNRCAELSAKCKEVYTKISQMPPQDQVLYADETGLKAISEEVPTINEVVDQINMNNIFARKIIDITNKLYGVFKGHRNNIDTHTIENKLGRLQKQVVRLKSQKNYLNVGNQTAIRSVKKAIESVRGALTSERCITRIPSDPDPTVITAENKALESVKEALTSDPSIPRVASGSDPAVIITESIKKALESVRAAITSKPSIPRVVSGLDTITELPEESDPNAPADFDPINVPQKMPTTARATQRTGRLDLEIPSDELILLSVQRSYSATSLTEEGVTDQSSEVDSSSDDDDSQEIEALIQMTERRNSSLVSHPSIPKLNQDPIDVNQNASPILKTKQQKVDSSEPSLIPQQITDLIVQMKASNVISPEDKEAMTQTIRALLGASPAIEPIPLQPPLNPPSTIHEVEKKNNAFQELGNLLLLFQNSSSQDHKDHLLALESKKFKLPIIGNPSVDVAGRIYFHLYFIHKEKSQGRLVKDRDYGKNAMMGIYSTTPEERIRAISRAIAEFALQQLEDAVNANQFEDVQGALSTLEGQKIHPSDMPKEQHNLAHALFGKMYNKHVEARKNKLTLVDPRDWPKFRGDFGRKAFSVRDGIDAADKIAVIKDLYQELKKVWQIP